MDKFIAWRLRDLATEFLDIEIQLANDLLCKEDIEILDIRQEQIADEIKEIF